MVAEHGARYGLDAARDSLGHYLRALWNDEFILRASDQPLTQQRPFISAQGIHLPRHYHAYQGTLQRELYRAASAHAAAHLAYSTTHYARGGLKPIQQALIGVLEDARVEQRAIEQMPGLRSLWLQFFDPAGRDSVSAEALLLRLSHQLLDPTREDSNPWVRKACRLFHESQREGSHALALREIGSRLGNDLGQMRAQFNAKTYVIEPVYRDDNLFLWIPETPPEETRVADGVVAAEDDAPDTLERLDDLAADDAHCRPRETASAGNDQQDDDLHPRYAEWNARTGHYRERWCRLVERPPAEGNASALRERMTAYAALCSRLARLMEARKQGQTQRLRHQSDGDEFELDALVSAISELRDLRPRQAPDLRVYRRTRRQRPDLSVLLLLDLSASTEATLGEATLLSLIREASVLLGTAIAQVGDRCAIHGFRSNGRHDIEYVRFKEFSETMDDPVLARLAGARGALSTRLGAAIRHASHQLRHSRTAQRMILVLTDGEPHDIDVFDPDYLVQDAARAVQRSAAEGTPVFCVSVDSAADRYLSTIFGAHQYQVIDQLDQLPQRLPELYLRLTA